MKRLLLTCLLTLSAVMLRAQDAPVRDSLLAQLATLPHDSLRLHTLRELVHVTLGDTEENQRYNDQLLSEAEAQNNDHYKCEAYYARLLNAYNSLDTATFRTTKKDLDPIARRTKRYAILFRAWRCELDLMILTQDYERNEREAQKMLAEAQALDNPSGILDAYQCLSNIYRNTFRETQAAETLEKALPLALQQGNQATIINTWQPLIFLYQDLQDFKNWLHTLQSFEAYLLSSLGHDSKDPIFLILYGNYLDYYTQRSDWPQAERMRLKAEQYYPRITAPLYKIYYDRLCARYFTTTGQYEKALDKVLTAKSYMEQMSRGVDYYSIVSDQAELLYALNRPQEALALYKEIREFKDNLHVSTINKQYEQLKKYFNADTLLLAQARLQHQRQLYMLILLAIGLLIAIYSFLYLLRNNRMLQKAEHDMREMARQMEQTNEAKDRFLSNISTTIHEPLHTVVEGSLRLAAGDITDMDERQLLSGQIRKMSSNLLKVINDILDLSRLEAGMMKYEISEVEASVLLLDAASISSAPRGVEIQAEYPEGSLFEVRIDGGRLLQVFTSLFDMPIDGQDQILLTIREENQLLKLRIAGSLLAQQNPSQEVIIRNEINRMLIKHFGGSYEIYPDQTPGVISITLPISRTIHPDSETK